MQTLSYECRKCNEPVLMTINHPADELVMLLLTPGVCANCYNTSSPEDLRHLHGQGPPKHDLSEPTSD